MILVINKKQALQSADGRVFQKFFTIGFVWSETRNRVEVQSDKVDFFDLFNIFFDNSIFEQYSVVKIIGLSLRKKNKSEYS